MAYTYQGLGKMSTPLTINMDKPLDTRTVVNNTSDLYTIPPAQAYRGMTISNLEDGNIYMLIDKNKITKSEGWKSSQSALQIISCTQEEYDRWSKNTNANYEPINPEEQYISQGVYYYIYEDTELGVYYLSSDWGKDIENQLKTKAADSALQDLKRRLDATDSNLATNYLTSEIIINTYATQAIINEMFNLEDSESYISKIVKKYYTKEESDSKYVTKESLGGDLSDLGDGENLVFVPSVQYAADKEALRKELDTTLKVNDDGSLNSLTVGSIKSIDGNLTVDVTKDGLVIGDDIIAKKSEIPVIITMSKEAYDAIPPEKIDKDAYYYLYNTEEDMVYVTRKELRAEYDNKGTYQSWVASYAYDKKYIDTLAESLQDKGDYVLVSQLENYYNKVETEDTFLKKEDASSIYATGDSLEEFKTFVSDTYLTIADISQGSGEEGPFKFVTETKYSQDKEAQAASLESENLITSKLTIKDGVELTANENRLLHNGDQVALSKEMHKVQYLTETDYLQLVAEKKTEADTYYYTYGQHEGDASGYVQLDYIEQTYYNRKDIDDFLGLVDTNTSDKLSSSLEKLQDNIDSISAEKQSQIDNITNILLVELENRLQAQIDKMQIYSEVSNHMLTLNDNDIMIVEGKTLHVLSPSKVSVNGLQIVVK